MDGEVGRTLKVKRWKGKGLETANFVCNFNKSSLIKRPVFKVIRIALEACYLTCLKNSLPSTRVRPETSTEE